MFIAHPLLPLRQFRFGLKLKQAGDLGDLAQQQAQGNGAPGNFRAGPAIRESAGQQIQMEHLLGVAHEAGQVAEIDLTQAGAFLRAGAVQR